MEGLINQVNPINTPGLPEKSKPDYKTTCEICGAGFEFFRGNYSYHIDIHTICSPQCYDTYHLKCSEENYKKYIKLIPSKFHNIDYDNQSLVKELYKKSVFITGKSGVGKTTLMSSLIKKYLRNFKDIKWISYPAFIMELQSAFRNDKGESPFDMASEVARFIGILAIDDIGAEKLTDFVRQITYYILNEREQKELPILITSNFSLEQIDEMIDPRVSSRIAGMCEVVKLTGKDRRLSK